jgi:pyruvate dehydrogenase E2 component (dihydrolipoamide acetyltransferase)
VNSSFTDEGIIEHDEVNVALATAIDEGLVSPVIANADQCTVTELAAERRRLVDAARTGTLTPSELLSATFTLSNLGPFGVTRFTALVVPPQAAILAVGSLCEQGVALTLSADHRVVDGAPAAVFLRQVIDQLEDRNWIGGLLSDQGPDPTGGEVS